MNRNRVFLFLGLFTVLNIVAAAFSELYNDEAYYWVYSRFLDWGYFDHPPVVALLIKMGYSIIQNELGVRLLSILTMSAALWIVFHLSDVDGKPFLLLIFSTFPFFLFGFTAMPDTPLVLSVALFFFVYDRQLKSVSWGGTMAMAVVMAFMLYSKYHGILVILFTIASNSGLLGKRWFWLASGLGALLFLPHLYWQFANAFPSIKFHLVDRSAKTYQFIFTLEYILGQIFYYGPFTGFFMFWAVWKSKTHDKFERALKFTVAGTLIFFLVSTLKGRVEVNWTIGMLVPLTILGMRYLREKSGVMRWFERVAWVSIAVLLVARVHLVFPLLDIKKDRTKDFHGHRAVAEKVEQISKGLPLASYRYQTASSLWFYTGRPVTVLNFNSRYSQFDLWDFDSEFANKKVAYISPKSETNDPVDDGLGFQIVDPFPIFKWIEVEVVDVSGTPSIKINWNKPLEFYEFTKKYPVYFVVDFLGQNDLQIHQLKIKVEVVGPTQTIAVEIPESIREKVLKISVQMMTDRLGVVRSYGPHVLANPE